MNRKITFAGIALALMTQCFYAGAQNSLYLVGSQYPNLNKIKNSAIKKLEKEHAEALKERKANNKRVGSGAKFEQENDDMYSKAKRWEWYWETRVSKEGWFPKPDILLTEWKAYKESHSKKNTKVATTPTWTFMGPTSSPGGYEGIGRVNCVAFHPTDANTFWVGSPDGGIWKTTNAGSTWTSSTDNAMPVLGVSSIAVDPTDANTLYAATGDGDGGSLFALTDGRYADTHSIGVLKSTDGGTTWNTTGLTFNVTAGALIRRIIISPTNSNVLLAASSNGIYRTTNGGTSWSNVKSGYFIDIDFKPDDPNTVYASMKYSGNFYVSTDGGATWTLTETFSSASRTKIGVTKADANVVDVLCAGGDGGFAGLYRSNDAGQTFSLIYADTDLNLLHNSEDGSGSGGQGTYDLCYAISPTDANQLYVGGINTWETLDGGTTWTLNTMWWASGSSAETVHADKHWMAFNPNDDTQLIQCNDGGVYSTTDGGSTWTDISNGLAISQMYRIACSQSNVNVVLTGLQDNGSKKYNNGTWSYATGGDGMDCAVDPTTQNTMYASYVNGTIYRSTDGFNINQTTISDNIPGQPTGAWVTPFVLDPNSNVTLYAGYSDVYKTTDKGNNWTQISSGLSSELHSLAVAPSNSSVIVAAGFYDVHRTSNGGGTWTTIETGLPSSEPVTYIAIHATDPNTMWASIGGYTAGQKVYKTTNGGTNWSSISGTLPNIPVNCIIQDKNSPNNAIYIGTDLGVYYRDDTMSDWALFGTGLPNVVVTDLDIHNTSGKMRAGTFGRGLWEVQLDQTVAAPTANFSISAASICDVQSTTLTNSSTGSVTSYSWDFGVGATPATASTVGPHTVSYSSTGSKTVQLTVTGPGGTNSTSKTVTVNTSPAKPTVSYNSGTMLLTCTASGVTGYQWQLNSVNIGGATQSTLQLNGSSSNGNYSCKVTNSSNCTATSDPVAVTIIGVNNNTPPLQFVEVYPNPANNELTVKQNFANYISSISIVNTAGQTVHKQQAEKDIELINISKLPQGVYFVKMQTASGYIIKKIQIQK